MRNPQEIEAILKPHIRGLLGDGYKAVYIIAVVEPHDDPEAREVHIGGEGLSTVSEAVSVMAYSAKSIVHKVVHSAIKQGKGFGTDFFAEAKVDGQNI